MNSEKHETYCNYNLTNLLIKLGFDWQDYFVTHDINEHFHWEIPLHIAQKWLREIKNYEVFVVVKFLANKEYIAHIETDNFGCSTDVYNFYESALEAGINKAAELILNKRK